MNLELETEFELLCRYGSYEIIDKFLNDNNIDISYDENYYIKLLALRNDVKLLELIKKHNGNLHYDDECLMNLMALHGYIDNMKYIIEDCENDKWKEIIKKTNAYTNCDRTKQFLDDNYFY